MLVALAVSTVLAGPPLAGTAVRDGIELRWTAPTSCPAEAEVAQRIDAALGPGTPRDPMVVDIIVRRADAGHAADLEITAGASRTTRELSASGCDTVVDAAILVVAMVHGQLGGDVAAVPEPTVAPAPTPASTAASPPTIDPASLEAPRQDDVPAPTSWKARPRGSAFADILLGFAGLPRIGAGLGGGLALVAHRVRAEATGSFWFARAADVGTGGGARVDVRLWTFGLRVGPVFYPRRAEIALLVGAQAGMAHGKGENVANARSVRRPWVSAGFYPTVLWPFHPRVALGLRGSVEGVALRPVFGLRQGGTRFTASSVTGSLSAVIEVRFP